MIHAILSRDYNANAYLVTGERTVLIDPGLPGNPYLARFLNETHASIDEVVVTHCHYDHIGGCGAYPSPHAHEMDADAIETGSEKTAYRHFASSFAGFPVSRRLREGDVITTGEHELEVVHTPGHTEGSICLYEKESRSLISGDTWFSSGVGRMDLPSGNYQDLERSFARLADLAIDTVYPGHGPVFPNNIDVIRCNFFGVGP